MNPKSSATQKETLSVVIPCHNEADAIPAMSAEVRDFLRSRPAQDLFADIEVIVVDDASSDQSPELLKRHSCWRTIRSLVNLGYGGALRLGFNEARGSLLLFLDMDRTYCIEDVIPMAKALESTGADVVFGRRPRVPQSEMPLIRKIGNQLFATLTRSLARHAPSDVCTGLRLMRATSVKPLLLSTKESGLDYSMALTVAMIRSGIKWTEVPVQYRQRLGESKLTVVGDGFRFLWALTRGVYGQRPEARH